MTAPWESLRPADAPSEAALDAYVTGEASPAQRAAVAAWAAASAANAEALAARQAGFGGLPGANPQAMSARIEQALAAEARPARPAPRARWRWPTVGALLAAGVAAGLAVWWPGAPPGDPVGGAGVETVQVKGSLRLRVVRRRGEAVAELVSGDHAQAGDRLRFLATGGPVGGHLLVVGAESDGALFPYVPADGRALPASALGEEGALPGAALLDDSSGREWIFLVWCAAPIGLDALGPRSADHLTLPAGCQATPFELHKP